MGRNFAVDAWLFRDNYVVIKKSQIKNAKDEEFKPVRLVLPEYFILTMHKAMNDEFLCDE